MFALPWVTLTTLLCRLDISLASMQRNVTALRPGTLFWAGKLCY